MTRKFIAVYLLAGLFLGLSACSASEADSVAATRQAIAFVLTYQAENPQPTDTPWPGWETVEAILTGQPGAAPIETVTLTPTVTPRPVGTPAPAEIVALPAGDAPALDGIMTPGEWDGAGQVWLQFESDLRVPVYVLRAGGQLFVAFDQLDQGEAALFPEIYIDAANNRADAWDQDDWWFHLSTRQCQGRGLGAIWAQCGGEQAWQTTDFVTSGSTIEMAIPYTTLALPGPDQSGIGIAFALMRLEPDDSVSRRFWPARSSISQPSTWGAGVIEGGW